MEWTRERLIDMVTFTRYTSYDKYSLKCIDFL